MAKNIFDKIFVISPQPYLPKVLQNIKYFRGFNKFSGFKNYQIDGIDVRYPVYLTLPLSWWREKLDELMQGKIREELNRISEISIAHVHFLQPTALAAIYELPKLMPKIMSLHGGDLYAWAYKNQSRAKAVMEKFDILHVPTRRMAKIINEIDPTLKPKIRVIPPGVNLTRFCLINERLSEPKLLMVANLIPEKGITDGIKVFEKLKLKYPNLTMDIIGDGPLYLDLKIMLEKQNIRGVNLLGAVAHEKLPEYYQHATIFLFPSYEESLGIVQVEALACGTPVVAYENEGSNEIFRDHPEYLVVTGNIKDMIKKVDDLLGKTSDRSKLRKLAEPYHVERVARQWRDVYQLLLNIK